MTGVADDYYSFGEPAVSAVEKVKQTLVAVVKTCWRWVQIVEVGSVEAVFAAAVAVAAKTGCCTRHTVTARAH